MGIFDGLLGNWIQIIDDQNEITIENYGYDTGVIEGTTGNHCVKCVAVNKCWFKNEKAKKPEKFNYWIKSFGYYDIKNFISILFRKTKESYFYGNYTIINHTKYGCKVNLQLDIPGVNEKEGKVYKVKTNYMIFPNGKLKCNTLLGGWIK